MRVLVTGGAGFIGSAVVRYIIDSTAWEVINVDKLTYAGNLESLKLVDSDPRYYFEHVDICNSQELERIFQSYQPDAVMHLAAESHVDRSIDGPAAFIETNIVGTYNLLEVARTYWTQLTEEARKRFRFHHVSTDEVYGDLEAGSPAFTEENPYSPSSPYAASKASSDHLVRAWQRTYGLPIVITNCSNNYGPYQFPEKLIPLVILNALEGRPLPIYGKGDQVRDWLYVEDHARALFLILTRGQIGETYNIGGHNERRNIEVVESICEILEHLIPDSPYSLKNSKSGGFKSLISFVADRPGHDLRYAINAGKIESDLGWSPQETFETGLRKTVQWFLGNEAWWRNVQSGGYRMERLGTRV